MRNSFIVVGAAVSAVLLAAAYEPARAACFSMPSFNAVYSVTNDADAKRIRGLVPNELSFRGRLGRVDRLIVVPGVTESIRVAADPVCKSRPLALAAAAGRGIGSDDLTAVIAARDAAGKLVRATVYRKACDAWLSTLSVGADAFRCASKPLRIDKTSKGQPMIELPLEKGRSKEMERLSVVVIGGADDAKLSAAVKMIGKAGETCARLAATRSEFEKTVDGFICVDTIYRDYGLDALCDSENAETWAVGPTDVEPTSCTLISPPTNDFGEHCNDNENDDEPKCASQAPRPITVLPLGDCGGIAIPFTYESIRGGTGKKRMLSGKSAVSRQADAFSGPINLPGGRAGVDFVGAMDLAGKSTDHRKPYLEVPPSLGGRELVIRGKVDSDGSAVLVFPRMPVSVVCKEAGDDDKTDLTDNEACQCFFRGENEGDVTEPGCARGNNTCRALAGDDDTECDTLSAADVRYYACEPKNEGDTDYQLTGLPCTRPEHCGDKGKCTPSTVCVTREEAVWQAGWTRPDDANECRLDKGDAEHSCPRDTHQCGLSLFDFHARYSIAHDLPPSGGASQPGVCSNKRTQPCHIDETCPGNGTCVGYTLTAGPQINH